MVAVVIDPFPQAGSRDDESAVSRPRVRRGFRGLQPDRSEPPFDPDFDQASRLERAAAPVMSRLACDLAGTDTALLLTDEGGQVVDRRVSDPSLRARLDRVLLGGEHVADALTDMVCAGAPVTDPHNGQVLGIIDITCPATNANSLMMPFAKRAAWEIEQRLLEGAAALELVLDQRFQQARRREKGPLALVGEHTIMTNPAAARIVEPSDQNPLWEWVLLSDGNGGGSGELVLAKGAVIAACEPIRDGTILVGALVRFRRPRPAGDRAATKAESSHSDRRTFGWGSLTESEWGVADLVAEGLTNRQVATRLFLSPHTVDAHLRHIFRKLGIGSRVELARMVAEHAEGLISAQA
jgi:DNA-binding CsgD family transcriptional regulator